MIFFEASYEYFSLKISDPLAQIGEERLENF